MLSLAASLPTKLSSEDDLHAASSRSCISGGRTMTRERRPLSVERHFSGHTQTKMVPAKVNKSGHSLKSMVRIPHSKDRITWNWFRISASTGYKSSWCQLRMWVYLPISNEVVSMYRELTLRRWNPISAGTPWLDYKVAEIRFESLEQIFYTISGQSE